MKIKVKKSRPAFYASLALMLLPLAAMAAMDGVLHMIVPIWVIVVCVAAATAGVCFALAVRPEDD
ncbi:MAG: hypothetical protein WC498_00395 [Candidatus Saccharimonadales bacterium]